MRRLTLCFYKPNAMIVSIDYSAIKLFQYDKELLKYVTRFTRSIYEIQHTFFLSTIRSKLPRTISHSKGS